MTALARVCAKVNGQKYFMHYLFLNHMMLGVIILKIMYHSKCLNCSKCISHYITNLIHKDFHTLHMMLKSYDVNMGYIYCYFQFTSYFALKDLIWQTLWHWVINQEDIFRTDREKREDQITFYFLTFWSFWRFSVALQRVEKQPPQSFFITSSFKTNSISNTTSLFYKFSVSYNVT